MSWIPQRWRTQRNAIRNANCRTQWIIKSLNAHCASGYPWEHACFSVCNTPHPLLIVQMINRLKWWTDEHSQLLTSNCDASSMETCALKIAWWKALFSPLFLLHGVVVHSVSELNKQCPQADLWKLSFDGKCLAIFFDQRQVFDSCWNIKSSPFLRSSVMLMC